MTNTLVALRHELHTAEISLANAYEAAVDVDRKLAREIKKLQRRTIELERVIDAALGLIALCEVQP